MGFFGSLFGGGASNFNPVINASSNLQSTSMGQGTSLFGQSQGISGLLSAFDKNQLTNPQGLGATTIAQQLTQAGQGAGGAAGAARQRAMDIGARTGNTAAIPGMIAGANKTGMTNMADTTNKLAIQNAMMKQQQQEQGAAGLSSLFGQDLGAAHNFESLSNDATKTEDQAIQQKNAATQQGISNMMKIGGMAMGGIGNLDMTGGSSPMEQLMNFAGGA